MVADAQRQSLEVRPPERLYFVNGPVDFLVIGAGSVLLFALAYFVPAAVDRNSMAISWALALSWVVNWPHFSATSYRLYRSRENIAQFPLTAVLVPVLVTATMVGALASPLLIAPAFVHLFALWSPYHFSGQSVGISLVYARRGGFTVGKAERLVLSGFIFGTYFLQTVRAEGLGASGNFWGVTYSTLGLPVWATTVATAGLWSLGVALVVLFVLWRRRSRPVPVIVLVPAVTQFTWFVLGPSRLSFAEFVPFFHSLQYLLIAWSMQLKERMDSERIVPSPDYVRRETARWGIVNIAGGACLFWVIPHTVAGTGVPLAVATAVVLSAVQIHHFFVDGVIWKLKNPKVASPLMTTLQDVLGHPAAPVVEPART